LPAPPRRSTPATGRSWWWISAGDPPSSRSGPTERFLHGDPPRAEELAQAISVVEDYLDDVRRDVDGAAEAARLVGLAGTVSTIAAVEIGLAEYDRDRIHHFVLSRHATEDVFRTLAMEKRADRVFNPGLEAARADVIVGGCIILVAIMRRFGFSECLVSEEDILDGLAMTLLEGAGGASRR
jgi:exopolyphosphatase / guanosine-5'-triphosphate,3'-diphosphate pyrophosphatase